MLINCNDVASTYLKTASQNSAQKVYSGVYMGILSAMIILSIIFAIRSKDHLILAALIPLTICLLASSNNVIIEGYDHMNRTAIENQRILHLYAVEKSEILSEYNQKTFDEIVSFTNETTKRYYDDSANMYINNDELYKTLDDMEEYLIYDDIENPQNPFIIQKNQLNNVWNQILSYNTDIPVSPQEMIDNNIDSIITALDTHRAIKKYIIEEGYTYTESYAHAQRSMELVIYLALRTMYTFANKTAPVALSDGVNKVFLSLPGGYILRTVKRNNNIKTTIFKNGIRWLYNIALNGSMEEASSQFNQSAASIPSIQMIDDANNLWDYNSTSQLYMSVNDKDKPTALLLWANKGDLNSIQSTSNAKMDADLIIMAEGKFTVIKMQKGIPMRMNCYYDVNNDIYDISSIREIEYFGTPVANIWTHNNIRSLFIGSGVGSTSDKYADSLIQVSSAKGITGNLALFTVSKIKDSISGLTDNIRLRMKQSGNYDTILKISSDSKAIDMIRGNATDINGISDKSMMCVVNNSHGIGGKEIVFGDKPALYNADIKTISQDISHLIS